MLNSLRQRIANVIFPRINNTMSLANEFLRYGTKGMTPNWTQVIMQDKDMYTGYSYATIRNRSNYVASLSVDHVNTQSEKEDFVHPYLELISSSPQFTDYEFWYVISTYLDLEGVYYLMAVRNVDGERVGNVQEFKLLNPYNITKVIDRKTGEVGGYREVKNGLQRDIPKEMIIEMRELNPFSNVNPFSMADAAKESQFTLKTSGDFTRNTLKHNINSPGIITTDVILGSEDFQNFTKRVKGHTKGEPLFGNGSGAIKFDAMNIDLSKSALKDVNELNREALFSIAGVSKTIMGIEQSGTTRETAKVQKDLLIEGQIIPRARLITDALNQDYKNNYPSNFITNGAMIVVNNPLKTDHESDLKATEVKQKDSDLYNELLDKGYGAEISAQYVNGEIGIEELGEPANPPEPEMPEPVIQEAKSCDHDSDIQKNQVEESERERGTVTQQEGGLRNAVTNIQDALVATAITRVQKKTINNQFEDEFTEESDIITKTEKNAFTRELEMILIGFYGIIINLKGGDVMRSRVTEFFLPGQFSLNKAARDYIKTTAKKTAKSHIDTITSDVLKTTREAALKGFGQQEIINEIKQKYSDVITETRAKTIARTETNRAFTRAQYDADVQFLKQNKLNKRAFKQWMTRSDNPCPFCISMEARGPIPFGESFASVGDTLRVDGKKLPVKFETVKSGNLHPNCSCTYELIIKTEEENSVDVRLEQLRKDRVEFEKEQKEFREYVDEVSDSL